MDVCMFTPSEWKELIALIEEFEPVRRRLHAFLLKLEDEWNEEYGYLLDEEMTKRVANACRRIYAVEDWRECVEFAEINMNDYEKWVLL